MFKKSFLFISIFLMIAFIAFATIPQKINYQGYLTDSGGTPVTTTTPLEMTFSIYSSEATTTFLWQATYKVDITGGRFNILLGDPDYLTVNKEIPYTVFDGSIKYLGIKVGSDAEMAPRKKLVSVGNSFRAHEADKLDGKDASAFVQKIDNVTPASSGNVDFVAGSNMTITPDASGHKITFSATPGGSGGNTLDQAYDQGGAGAGRTINADAGAVKIDGADGLTVNGKLSIGTTNQTNLLNVEGPGTDVGGVIGYSEVVAHFKRTTSGHSVISVDALPDKDAAVYLAKAGAAIWGLRNDASEGDKFKLRYQGSKTFVTVDKTGKVGIGKSSPAQKLDVNGTAQMTGFKMTTSASNGKVLTSDASGNGTWKTVSASGDNLGNHTATQNIKLNNKWLSNDGGNEGVRVSNGGNVGVGISSPGKKLDVGGDIRSTTGYIVTGTPTASGGLSAGDIVATDDIQADDYVYAGGTVWAKNDLKADDDLTVGDDAFITDYLQAGGDIKSTGGKIVTGSPTSPGGVSANDIAATDDVLADDYGWFGRIMCGPASHGGGMGDIAADDDVYVDDDLFVYGAKSAVLKTDDYGERRVYCDESTEVYFFDRGRAQLVNGELTIYLDPIFLETITISKDISYLVQITLNADCNGVYVTNRTATSFTVKELKGGTSNAAFFWEIAAKRKGYEHARLELMEEEQPGSLAADPPNSPVEVDENAVPIEKAPTSLDDH